MVANGRLLASSLRTVAPGTQLVNPTAAAYLNMALVGKLDGIKVAPVDGYGSGYRSFAVQTVFWNASRGDTVAAAKANIDPNLHVTVAAPGYSSHGTGDRIDLLFNGRSPSNDDLELAARYGFTREFGAADRNHFRHDRKTAVSGVTSYDVVRLTGEFLNSRHLGRTTRAAQTGKRDSDFIWMVQHYGHLTHTYPASCVEDGETGPNTEKCFTHLWGVIRAAA